MHTDHMAAGAAEVGRRGSASALGALAGSIVLGVVAVLLLPEIAGDIPHPGTDEQARYALTGLGVAAVTVTFVYALGAVRRGGLERAWQFTAAYGCGLAAVKFVLSPTAFRESTDVTLGSFVVSGVAVVPVYLGAIAFLYVLASRRSGEWPVASKLRVAVLLGVLAVATRYVAALALGTGSEYARDLAGSGLVLPVVVALASMAVMEAFDRSRPSLRMALAEAVAIVVVHHALWVVYMYRLF